VITIRIETAEDIPGIYAVHVASFPTEDEARLVDALRGSGRLTVSPDYYPRFGFKPGASHALTDEYLGSKAFQVLELRSGSIPPGGSLIRYAPEFGVLGG
jgi:predicted N-acetyltransferase YhbS